MTRVKFFTMLGPQGSGKGTQAELLAKKLGIPHISTGDLLRNMPRDTPFGKQVHKLIDNGNLLPDKLIAKLVNARLQDQDCRSGFILDGYPRTLPQARLLTTKPAYAIYLDISDEEAVQRISNRWQCRRCNTIYGIEAKPKRTGICDNCGGDLYQREDDKPEFVRKRLETFHRETEHLKEFYKKQEVLYVINGEQSIDTIFKHILKILKIN